MASSQSFNMAAVSSSVNSLLNSSTCCSRLFFFSPHEHNEKTNIAKREYDYFQSHTPEESGLSCIGEKYCSYYNVPVVDWCCYFAGYCYKEGGLDDDKSGFASVTNVWTSNLEEIGKLKSASSKSFGAESFFFASFIF